ncbi:MAG TPA: hypothetical protein DEG32_13620, partial [Balneolaceae bacterium]|nr:hypothetical protein [Balneolaceae bacterium]
MNPDTYLKDRLEDQINWYSRKASSNKSAYLRITTATLIFAVSIPLFAIYLLASENPLFQNSFCLAYFGFAGLAITVLSVLNHIYNYQDRWSHYRTVGEL